MYIPTLIYIFIYSFIHSLLACSHIATTIFYNLLLGKMPLILIALLHLSLLYRNVVSTCSTTSDVEFTFYGYPDGPSDTTSFGCSGTTKVADGTAGGSFLPCSSTKRFHPCPMTSFPPIIDTEQLSRRRLIRQPRNLRHRPQQPQLHPLRNRLPPPLPKVLPVHGPL